jgi:DNA-binding transcriptional ArsR family regulator
MRVPIVRAGLLAGAALFLLLPGPATAAPGQLALTGGIPLRLSGAADLEAEHGTFWLQPASQDLSLDPAAQGRILTLHSEYVVLADASLVRVVRTVDELPWALEGLRVVSAGPDAYLAATGHHLQVASHREPVPAERAWTEANVQLSLLLHPRLIAPPVAAAANDLVADPRLEAAALGLDAGLHESRADQATAQLVLDRLVVYDAQLATAAGDVATGRALDHRSGSVYTAAGWTGPGDHVEETVRLLVVEGGSTPLRLDAAAITLYSEDLLVHVDGLAQFAWAEGRLDVDGAPERVSDETLLGGRFELRALATDLERAPSVSWLGAGDIRLVRLGPVPPPDSAAAVAATVAAGGAAAVGALALLYYWPALKYAATALVMPLYARLPRDRVLDHGGRELVYERVRAEPGISAHRLADTVDFGWSTLAYHLRVLEKNELIVSVRDGRYRRFFDRESGRYANGRKHLVAVLKNDQTLAIARAVVGEPGVTQKALAQRFALSPSSIHWHVQRLEEARLLARVRDGHHVRYHPGDAWPEVDLADLGPAATAPLRLDLAAPVAAPDGPTPS